MSAVVVVAALVLVVVGVLGANDRGKANLLASAEVQGTSPLRRLNAPMRWWPWRLRLCVLGWLVGVTVALVGPWLVAGWLGVVFAWVAAGLVLVGNAATGFAPLSPRVGWRRALVRLSWQSVARSCDLGVTADRRLVGASESVRVEELPLLDRGRRIGPAAVRWRYRPPRGGTVEQAAERAEALAAALGVDRVQITRVRAGEGRLVAYLDPPAATERPAAQLGARPAPEPTTIDGEHVLDVGRDAAGGPWLMPLVPDAGSPHVLVAGATGAGKSSVIDALLAEVAPLEHVAVVFIDPARVAASRWRDRLSGVASKGPERGAVLRWLMSELDVRTTVMESAGVDRITEGSAEWPLVVLVVDEVADLDKSELVMLTELAQQARKVGFVLVAATQHPRGDVIGTVLRGQFGRRVCLHVNEAEAARAVLGATQVDGLDPLTIGAQNPGVGVVVGVRPEAFAARSYLVERSEAELIAASTAHLTPTLDGLAAAIRTATGARWPAHGRHLIDEPAVVA